MMPESAALSMWPADTVSLVPGFRTLLAVLSPCDELTRAERALGVLLFFVFPKSPFALIRDYSQPVHSQCLARALCRGRVLELSSRAQLLPPVNIRPQRAEAPPYTHA